MFSEKYAKYPANRIKLVLAHIFLLLPLLSHPLIWCRLFTGQMPYWGDAKFISLPAVALLSIGVALLYPERLKKLFSKAPARYWGIALAASAILAVIHQIIYPGSLQLLLQGMPVLFIPLAGIALSDELRKAAPLCGAVTAAVLALFTAAGDRYLSGFPGNWNWNFTMLCATIPALSLVIFGKKHPFRIAVGVITILMILLSVFRPELTPRGTIAAFILATCLAPALRKIDRTHRPAALTGAALAAGFIFVATVSHKSGHLVNDSRFQLWRSSVEMVNARLLTGYGPGRFESAVQPHITKEYFFTEYAATNHPHPHNEFLLCISDFGICGALVLLFFAGSALKPNTGKKCQQDRWMVWLFILLLMHGQVDVLLSTPLAGTWFLLTGGALSARGIGRTPVGFKLIRFSLFAIITAAALIFAAVQFVSGCHLRRAKLELHNKNVYQAISHLQSANKLLPTRESRYIAGNVALFNLKRPDLAVNEFLKLDKEFCGGYIHSYGLTARALFAAGKQQEAREFFALERKAFPFSALYAGFELAALQLSNASSQEKAEAAKRFEYNLKLRDLDIGNAALIQKNPELDERPLKWSKKPDVFPRSASL